MEQYDSNVDAYINKSAAFSKPVLVYIRQIIHKASPLLTETIKWGCPFFDYKGPVCQMAAFKQHCALGFWKAALLNDPHKVLRLGDAKAGSFGDILSISDLPSKEILTDLILQAIALNEKGEKAIKKAPVEKGTLVIPDYFTSALISHQNALTIFNNFSPSQKREYIEWIVDAKTEATRQKRLDTAVEWIGEGKTRLWKYK